MIRPGLRSKTCTTMATTTRAWLLTIGHLTPATRVKVKVKQVVKVISISTVVATKDKHARTRDDTESPGSTWRKRTDGIYEFPFTSVYTSSVDRMDGAQSSIMLSWISPHVWTMRYVPMLYWKRSCWRRRRSVPPKTYSDDPRTNDRVLYVWGRLRNTNKRERERDLLFWNNVPWETTVWPVLGLYPSPNVVIFSHRRSSRRFDECQFGGYVISAALQCKRSQWHSSGIYHRTYQRQLRAQVLLQFVTSRWSR